MSVSQSPSLVFNALFLTCAVTFRQQPRPEKLTMADSSAALAGMLVSLQGRGSLGADSIKTLKIKMSSHRSVLLLLPLSLSAETRPADFRQARVGPTGLASGLYVISSVNDGRSE